MRVSIIYYFTFVAVLFFVVACQSKNERQKESIAATEEVETMKLNNVLTEAEKAAGWQLLFDGKTTEHWRGYNLPNFPEKGWNIDQEGNLRVSASGAEEAGFGGDIVSKAKFENFELLVDFMVSDTGNSGIFYRVLELEGEAIWHSAPEFQVLDNQTYIDMGGMDMTKHLTGDNYDLHVSTGDYSNAVGEWNTAKIVVNNNEVEHWLNGKQTVKYSLESPEWANLVKASKFANYPQYGRTRLGHIGLQDHGHLVKFRNIKIRQLK